MDLAPLLDIINEEEEYEVEEVWELQKMRMWYTILGILERIWK